MIDMAYEHVTGIYFSQTATLNYKYYIHVSVGVYEKATATRITDV